MRLTKRLVHLLFQQLVVYLGVCVLLRSHRLLIIVPDAGGGDCGDLQLASVFAVLVVVLPEQLHEFL